MAPGDEQPGWTSTAGGGTFGGQAPPKPRAAAGNSEPHKADHHDPKPQGGAQPRHGIQNLNNIPPPTIFLLLFGLFGLYIAFSSWQNQQHQKEGPVIYTTSSATVHQVVPPREEDLATIVSASTRVVVQTVTVTKEVAASSQTSTTTSTATSKGALARNRKDQKKEPKTKELSTMSSSEQTFIAIKPDGVQRGLVGPIISRFENRGFKLVAIKMMSASKEHLEKHYEDLSSKPFFPGLIKYMGSGPICAMVWEGRDAVKTGRAILGATNPLASAPGTIRGDYAIDVGRNVCHGSDSVENAKKEIALWFKEGEVVSWKSAQFDWIYEKA